ncbi:type I-C CRISPR-associated protein Cas8c/Csd1 [Terriglobus albidus]|uniref:type I-C CRISPR-associated protein Cas8c/Csd1 n=1 Tax=Terriglobus albidus TaxID=1592106 RepID=UPI0021DF9FF9|nr:type I-C CRISPR-associated protein Cas8c/Csd1 [Terriglobus albidus]
MILQSLCELAEREQLVGDPAFEKKAVRWIVVLDASGRFVDVRDTSAPESLPSTNRTKWRWHPELTLIPRRQERSSGIRANFLVDNGKYALGFSATPEEKDDPRHRLCHAAFVSLLREAPQDVPQLQSLLAFLANEEELNACAVCLASKGSFANKDLFGFEVDGIALSDLDRLRNWWGSHADQAKEELEPIQCLVCGKYRQPARLHNSIQIRGASASGAPLISFNVASFEKYGLRGNENAPVCRVCMTAYTEALRRLTRPQYETASGKKLQAQRILLNGNTTVVYWCECQSALPQLLTAMDSDPKSVKDAVNGSFDESSSRFYCLILSGAQGRASIRYFRIGTVGEVIANLRRYFCTIDIDRRDRNVPLTFFRLLTRMAPNGERDRLPSEIGIELWVHTVFGDKLPYGFLNALVARNQAEHTVPEERAALLHLYFASGDAKSTDVGISDLHSCTEKHSMSLDCESTDLPYLFGRLLAIMENLQSAAQGTNLGRILVARTFRLASTRPGQVFPSLLQASQQQLARASRKVPARAANLNRLIGEVLNGIPANGLSPVFNLEQQGRFALGYYHQRQVFFDRNGDMGKASIETANDSSGETMA